MKRREFLGSAAAVAAFTIVPRHVLGGKGFTAPSEKLNIAGIGCGGMGGVDLERVSSENIVALCDVDDSRAARTVAKFPDARRFKDFRVMLDEMDNEIDAVVVATPDHVHAIATMTAIKHGKHVYCEKPLTHTVYEARAVAKAAREAGVATQMGNHGHSSEGIRLVKEWIAAGAIGHVREVQCFTPLPRGIWQQGIARPTDTPPVPDGMDWDLWIGPAPFRAYHPAYAPVKWRGWWDFGTGTLGDQACHTMDVPFFALDFDAPDTIEASCTDNNGDSYPLGEIIRYHFPERNGRPAVEMTWHDGGLMPEIPDVLEPGRKIGNTYGGIIFKGDDGMLICSTYGESPRLIPETRMKAYTQPPKTLPRVEGHHQDWIDACKGGDAASSNFDYAGPLSETVLLGNVAVRAGRKLNWDGANLTFPGDAEANKLLHYDYREGWKL